MKINYSNVEKIVKLVSEEIRKINIECVISDAAGKCNDDTLFILNIKDCKPEQLNEDDIKQISDQLINQIKRKIILINGKKIEFLKNVPRDPWKMKELEIGNVLFYTLYACPTIGELPKLCIDCYINIIN